MLLRSARGRKTRNLGSQILGDCDLRGRPTLEVPEGLRQL